MHKIYRVVSTVLHALSSVVWLETLLLLNANTEQVVLSTGIIIAIGAVTISTLYWFVADGNFDKLYNLLMIHPHAWVLSATGVLWIVPAVMVDPWSSFAAVTAAYIMFYGAYVAEERYLKELRKSKQVFDDFPPF